MKKLMTSTIILLPLLLLAIMLVSGAIMSLVTHIYVEQVEFVGNGALVLVMEDEAEPPTEKLEVNILPLKAENRGLSYSVVDEDIATVDQNGNITARDYGETYVTVTSKENKAAVARRKVLVTDSHVHRISINDGYSRELYENATEELHVSVIPKEAENKSVKWESSDESILRVNPNGVIRAVGEGTATITVVSHDNEGAHDSIQVTCHKEIKSIDFKDTRDEIPMQTAALEADFPEFKITPAGAFVKELTYTSNHPEIATVDGHGHITFSKMGAVTVTATVTDFGDKKVSISRDYTSTDDNFILPLFTAKEPVVDFEDYYEEGAPQQKALPVEFNKRPPDVEGEYIGATYAYLDKLGNPVEGPKQDALEFDMQNEKFYLTGVSLPEKVRKIRVTVSLYAYKNDETNGAQRIEASDYFILTVNRNATSVEVKYPDPTSPAIQSIQTSMKRVQFGTGTPTSKSEDYAHIVVLPANHTNDIAYDLAESRGSVEFDKNFGTLTFKDEKAAGYAKVKIALMSGSREVLSTFVEVRYEPPLPQNPSQGEPQKQQVQVPTPQEGSTEPVEPLKVTLNPVTPKEQSGPQNEPDNQDMGTINFTEPANTTVEYEVVEASGSVAPGEPAPAPVVSVEKDEVSGVPHIIAHRGGFATILITVTPGEAEPLLRTAGPREGNADGSYTISIDVYVNYAVEESDFEVKFGAEGTVCTDSFAAKPGTIPFTVTVKNGDGRMEGKKFHITYGGEPLIGEWIKGTDAENTNAVYTGELDLSGLNGNLNVTFGLQYTEEAVARGADADAAQKYVVRTILCNANGIDVTYGNVKTTRIVTHASELTFGEKDTDAVVTVSPAKHTDTLSYALKENAEGVSLNRGRLTFTSKTEVSVTVLIQLKRGGEVTLEKEITVIYVPTNGNNVAVKGENNEKVLLTMNGEKVTGTLYLTEPEGAKVTYAVAEGGEDVVEITESTNGVQQIKAKRGGFATVTITAGEETRTIHVYVDQAVSANDFTFKFGEQGEHKALDLFCTTLTNVSYDVSMKNADAMSGKRIMVSYGSTSAHGNENAATHSGTISFPEDSSSLRVTFGVEYTDAAKGYLSESETKISVTHSVVLYRNPNSLTLTYGNGSEAVQSISVSDTTLDFDMGSGSLSAVHVNILPASAKSTCTVVYSFTDKSYESLATLTGSTLQFPDETKSSSVTVKVSLVAKDGTTVQEAQITVAYAPRSDTDKEITIDDTHNDVKLLLKINSNGTKDTGVVRFSEPADHTVTAESDKQSVATVEKVDGTWKITPVSGGFAVITVKATPTEGDAKEYKIHVYVDRQVTEGDFTVKFGNDGGTVYAKNNNFYTIETSVPYTVTVANDGRMEGKKIIVTYDDASSSQSGTAGELTLSGTISFPETLRTLTVTFSVEYDTETTAGYDPEEGLGSITRTIERNAKSLSVDYNGQAVQRIVISTDTFTFGEANTTPNLTLTVEPATHTDTLTYELTENGSVAELTEKNGLWTLTFKNAGEATVTISLKRNGELTDQNLSKQITVVYAPIGNAKAINVGKDSNELKVVLGYGSGSTAPGEGIIYFTEVADKTYEYKVTKGENDVLTLAVKDGAQHIKAVKGGFATVEITADGEKHTIQVYVDETVQSENFTVSFSSDNGAAVGNDHATTAEKVTVTVTTSNAAAMQGKELYYKVGSAFHKLTLENGSYTGTIDFPKDGGDLTLNFVVKYAEDTVKDYAVSGDKELDLERTLLRDTDSVTVTYDGITVYEGGKQGKIVTKENSLTFSDYVTAKPEKHSDKLYYTLAEGAEGTASISTVGALSFTKAGSVTVTIYRTRDGDTNKTELAKVTVVYVPTSEHQKAVTKDTTNLLLKLDGSNTDMGILYFTQAAGQSEVDCTVKTGEGIAEGVVNVEKNEYGVWQVKALKGGFATLTITANGEEYTVEVYVDVPVTEDEIEIKLTRGTSSVMPTREVENHIVSYTSYVTSNIYFKVTLKNANIGSLEGKKFYVKVDNEIYDDMRITWYAYSSYYYGYIAHTIDNVRSEIITDDEIHKITFGIEYDEAVSDFSDIRGNILQGDVYSEDRWIQSTHNKALNPLKVTYSSAAGSGTLNNDGPTNILFTDFKSQIKFAILSEDRVFDPSDISYSGTYTTACSFEGSYGVTYALSWGTTYPYVLTAGDELCTDISMYITIYGQRFELLVSVQVAADTIGVVSLVKTNADDSEQWPTETMMRTGTEYKTLVDSLALGVTISRVDGKNISNKNIQYSYDNVTWETVQSSSTYTIFSIDTSKLTGVLYVRSADKGASTQFLIEKVNGKDVDFNFKVFVHGTNGRNDFAYIDSFMLNTSRKLSYAVPADMQSAITFEMDGGKFLGGYGTHEQFMADAEGTSLASDYKGTWTITYGELDGQIYFETQNSGDFTMECTVSYFGKSVTVTFSHYNRDIEFPGFDRENLSDIYKGYQQVRVFAKHSDYAEGGVSNVVDYFKLPVQTLKAGQSVEGDTSLASLNWTFTGYTGNTANDFTMTQTGETVTYKNVSYTITVGDDGKVKLMQGEEIIAQNGKYEAGKTKVPWVDCYSETGYAYVYFGEFGGLSEVDVQNDYFGNFAEKETWTQPTQVTDDKSGRNFAITTSTSSTAPASFTYLKVQAELNSNNRYFNFNVLADPEGGNLVNVFNATGYYNNTNMVLHANLYGPGELGSVNREQDAADNDLILNDGSKLNRTTIYGNGNQINCEAQHVNAPVDNNANVVVSFSKLYNVIVKGGNPVEKINTQTVRMQLKIGYAYYSDIQYYIKLQGGVSQPSNNTKTTVGNQSIKGNALYLKNTTLRRASLQAVLLWASYDKDTSGIPISGDYSDVYLENVVETDCMLGISPMGFGAHDTIYIKNFLDALNYIDVSELADRGASASMGYVNKGQIVTASPTAMKYVEWFGKEKNLTTEKLEDWYLNPVIVGLAYGVNMNNYYWDGNAYKKAEQRETEGSDKMVPAEILAGGKNAIEEAFLIPNACQAFVYNALSEVDSGITSEQATGSRTMSKLLTSEREIRLLCQYLAPGLRNDAHILWHLQKVYRDPELIEGRTTDHQEDFEQSLKDAIASGRWNGKWADGSSISEAGINAAALTAMLSQTTLPSKFLFE